MAKKKQTETNSPVPQATQVMLQKYWWLALVAFATPVVIRKIQDVDLWWHMQIGRSVLESWDFPDLRQFYWSHVSNLNPEDFRFTWLGDVLLHLAYSIGGAFLLQGALWISVLGSVFLFLYQIPKHQRFLALPIGMLMIAATYQLQILRNAAFSIVLFALVCWLWQRSLERPRTIWWMVPLLGIWSCLHGSYLLGFMVFGLFLTGYLVELAIAATLEKWQAWAHHLGALILSFAAISLWNPFTIKALTGLFGSLGLPLMAIAVAALIASLIFYAKVFRHWQRDLRKRIGNATSLAVLLLSLTLFFGWQLKPLFVAPAQLETLELRLAPGLSPEDLNWLQKVQHGLNNSFWKSKGEVVASLDFRSPFDFLGDLYVWSSLVLIAIALFMLIRSGYGKWSLWISYLPLILLGLGYVRTIGLAGMFGAFLICHLWKNQEFQSAKLRWASAATTLLLFCGLAGQLLSLGVPFGLYSEHKVGFGADAFFPARFANELPNDWKEAPLFTTIENGGYLLYHWYPEKQVFMDGFIGPHKGKALNLYNQALAERDPEILYEQTKVAHALIGLRDREWMEAFMTSPQWVPVHLSLGGISFIRCAQALDCNAYPEIQLTEREISAAPKYLHTLFSHYYMNISINFIEQGYLIQASQLWTEKIEPKVTLVDINPQKYNHFKLTLNHFLGNYGMRNSALIALELDYFQALNANNDRKAFEYGRKLLADQPKRGDLYLGLIEIAKRLGNQEAQQQLVNDFTALQKEVRQQQATD